MHPSVLVEEEKIASLSTTQKGKSLVSALERGEELEGEENGEMP